MSQKIPYLYRQTAKGITYYRYRMPDGTYQPLGKDFDAARQIAEALNAEREKRSRSRLSGVSMGELIDFYRPIKLSTTKSRASQREINRMFNNLASWLEGEDVGGISVRTLDEILEEHAPLYEPYRKYRLYLGELFDIAISKGWRKQVEGNPGRALLPPRLSGRKKGAKVRVRITLPQFEAIYNHAPSWLQLAMDLALIIGIRRTDVCNLKLEQFKDDGCLYFIPSKTSDLPNPAALKIKHPRLKGLISRSKSLPPLSPFFLHKVNKIRTGEQAEDREHITQVLPEQLSRHFNKARAAAMGAHPELFKGLKPEQLPGYHEIRSLCSRIYMEEGRSPEWIQSLLGHADISMTEVYLHDPEKVTWQEIVI